MSAAVSGFVVGKCKIVVAANGCMKCGVEFSEGWTERKVQIVINGRRGELGVPICAGCAPFSHDKLEPAGVPPRGRSV